MTNRKTIALLLAALAVVPLGFVAGDVPLTAADHLDPPSRTDPANDSTPDIPADIADIYAFHDASKVTLIVTFGGPAAANQPARYDANVLLNLNISNREPRTTAEFPIYIQFGRETGVANGPWGVRVRGAPGVSGDIVGSVERVLQKDGVRVYAGLVDDPFFFDLQGFRETRDMGTLRFQSGRNFFAGQNITTIAIEIPRDRLESGSNLLDFWITTSRLGGQLNG